MMIDFMRQQRRLCLAMRDHHPEGPGGFASARQAGMRREMKTFEELRQVMTRGLLELKKLEDSRFTTIRKRHSVEQELGRRCYEAEEDLEPHDLNLLKRALGLSEREWRTYKATFIAGSSPESFS
jgi:hypothetical protein